MRLVIAGILACLGAVAAAPAPKHIIMFVIDDLGFSDVGYKTAMYNLTAPPLPTPTIDSLRASGIALENYYVTQLCSPTRTALLSGRYTYNLGEEDGVIVDGQDDWMPLNVSTIADHLSSHGWATSAYGKWDAGMTSWGCTPMCRGFDYFAGFFNADNDYNTHRVGPGLDLRNGWEPDFQNNNETDFYMTELVTKRVQDWITTTVKDDPSKSSFAYVAHEAIHAPNQVPARYTTGECEANIDASFPTRRIVCGMMKAVDDSVRNITQTYAALGIEPTIIFTTDNGGNPDTGGNNYPLRGCKATTFEGGLRALGFVSGAGLQSSVRGSTSHEFIHVTDWLPTIVSGIAGISLPSNASKSTKPIDGLNQWTSISTGGASPRTEALLEFRTLPDAPHNQTAYRMGKWKLMQGATVVWGAPQGGLMCQARNVINYQKSNTEPYPITAATAPPFCPIGWVPPPGTALPRWPSDVNCTSLPCDAAGTDYFTGSEWLFDLENDPYETTNVASENPDVVATIRAKLDAYAGTVPQVKGGGKDPLSDPSRFGGVWTPWRGDPYPQNCSTDVRVEFHAHVDGVDLGSGSAAYHVRGWVWDTRVDDGYGAVPVEVMFDNKSIGTFAANATRPNLPKDTGAPNTEHGFDVPLPGTIATGHHSVGLLAIIPGSPSMPLPGSPVCTNNGKPVSC